MCKYCEPFDGDINSVFDRQKIDLLEGRGLGTEMFLLEDDNNPGEFRLRICNNNTGEVISSIRLDYCPFCRRKLNKAHANMTETELINEAWEQVPKFNAPEPAWKSVQPYTGFAGSTCTTGTTARWEHEYNTEVTSRNARNTQFCDEYNKFLHDLKQTTVLRYAGSYEQGTSYSGICVEQPIPDDSVSGSYIGLADNTYSGICVEPETI